MKPVPLTFSPQANKASPASLMFLAALISRSSVVEHDGQSHVRIFIGSLSTVNPQSLQRFDDGNHLSILTSVLPYQSHLYDRNDRNCAQPESDIDLARQWFFTIFLIANVSTQIIWFSLTNFIDSLWWKSRRLSVIFACSLATLSLALLRLLEPLVFRLRRFCKKANLDSCFFNILGCENLVPSDVMAKWVNPKSIPISDLTNGLSLMSSSTNIDTKYRSIESFETVTVDGVPVNRLDQCISSGSDCLASFNLPSLKVNAVLAYVADCFDCFFLKLGYLARPAKKLVKATCKCLRDCCKGTLETSLSHAYSSWYFNTDSKKEVSW